MSKAGAWLRGMLLGAGKTLTEDDDVQELTALEQWEAVLADNGDAPHWLFKHSTTCPISAAAHRQVAAYLADRGDDATPVLLIKVIESRPVSNAIAAALGVTHQSPQMILLRNGQAVWNASHGSITAAALKDAVNRA